MLREFLHKKAACLYTLLFLWRLPSVLASIGCRLKSSDDPVRHWEPAKKASFLRFLIGRIEQGGDA